MRLQGRVALITGGTDGIGLATVRLFAREGCRMVVVARRPEPGRRLVQEISAECLHFLPADVAAEETARTAVDAALTTYGRLDVLINNAAVDFVRDVDETTREDLERIFASNFFGAFAMLREAGRAMKERGGGSIVNVTSRNASVGVPGMGAYAAAKGALLSLTRVAALEWAPHGIRVNAVAPGMTDTPLIRAWIDDQPQPAKFERGLVDSVPLGRLARPEDVAAAILSALDRKRAETYVPRWFRSFTVAQALVPGAVARLGALRTPT
jgi:NAD(P)-dependent dehydrogenase (short-subunit alcohol dehydrogenase family)